jgi:glycosyltransferase involved in cell wall biosynthesis
MSKDAALRGAWRGLQKVCMIGLTFAIADNRGFLTQGGIHLGSVSVIVSTYTKERSRLLFRCLKSLNDQEERPNEIILVLDPDEELISYYKSRISSDIKIAISTKTGLSNARNAGLKIANGEIVAFIDDDTIAEKDWLIRLLSDYNDPRVQSVGGSSIPLWEEQKPSWFPEELEWVVGCSYKGRPESKSYVRNLIGCNMSFRKSIFQKIGYFEDTLGRVGNKLAASEETEFCLRILSEIPDSKIVYDPMAKIYHVVPENRAKVTYVIKRSYNEGIAIAVLSRKMGRVRAQSDERTYIRQLVRFAIPSRISKIFRLASLLQLVILFLSAFSVGIGYLRGLSPE